jgi:hypothetical protein
MDRNRTLVRQADRDIYIGTWAEQDGGVPSEAASELRVGMAVSAYQP